MKNSAWKRITEMFSRLGRNSRSQAVQLDARARTNLVVGVGANSSRYRGKTADAVEFQFNFDPSDTTQFPVAGKRMKCPCCDDEFEAFPDGAIACPQCVGAMQSKLVPSWHVYSDFSK